MDFIVYFFQNIFLPPLGTPPSSPTPNHHQQQQGPIESPTNHHKNNHYNENDLIPQPTPSTSTTPPQSAVLCTPPNLCSNAIPTALGQHSLAHSLLAAHQQLSSLLINPATANCKKRAK
jgi:hypothetical protein